MIIRSLQTTNYRQHRGAHTWVFDGNLVGIVGPNGSGKSHLIDALEFLFTGKVGGQNKSDMVSWGEAEGHVRGTFVHEGAEGEIYRELHGNKATLKFRDVKVTGITNVNTQIGELTGMDAEICRQAVFVHQKEIDAILFTEPSARQLAWQRLCGLSMANGIHADLGELIGKLPPVTDWAEPIKDCETRIAALNQQIEAAAKNLGLEQSEIGEASYDQVHQYLEGLTTLSALMSQAVEYNKQLARCREEVSQSEANLLKLREQVVGLGGEAPQTRREEVQAEINVCQALLQLQKDVESSIGWERAYSQQLAALVPPVPGDQKGIDLISEELTRRKADEATIRSQLSLYRQLYAALVGLNPDARCPLCLRVLDAGTNLKPIVEKTIEELEAKARELDNNARRTERQLGDARAHLAEYLAAADRLRNDLAGIQRLLASQQQQQAELQAKFGRQPSAQLLNELQAVRQDLYERARKFEALQRDTAWEESALAGYKKAAAALTTQLDAQVASIKEKMTALRIDDPGKVNERILAMQEERCRLNQVHNQLGELNGQMTQMRSQLQNLEQSLASLRQREAGQAGLHQTTQTLTRVRDWFHYTNGPQAVINTLHGRITAGVNDFLQRFGAAFYVMPDTGTMSFRYCYYDGRPMPDGFPTVDQLSGGEAIVLAVSFRLATYCLFAGRVGLLTLDEPTVYLDEKHVSQFCTLLERVKEIAAGMNLQIFISTHERSVIPFLDSVINLDTVTNPNPQKEL